jgi:hypothetical protein
MKPTFVNSITLKKSGFHQGKASTILLPSFLASLLGGKPKQLKKQEFGKQKEKDYGAGGPGIGIEGFPSLELI